MNRVRAIIIDQSERVLLGLNEYNEYALPGGKIKDNEHPVDAVIREVKEETGINNFNGLEHQFDLVDNKVFLWGAELSPEPPDPSLDPSKEFSTLGWFDLSNIPRNLDEYSEEILYHFLRDTVKTVIAGETALAGTIEVLVDGKKVYDLDDDMIWETLPRLAQERSKGKKVEFRQILDDGTIIDQTPQAMPDAVQGYHHQPDDEIDNTDSFLDFDNPENRAQIEDLDSTPVDAMQDIQFNVYVDGELIRTCKNSAEIGEMEGYIVDMMTQGKKVQYKQLLKTGEEVDFTPHALPTYMKVAASGNWERAKQMTKIYKMVDELLSSYIPEEKNRPSVEILYNIDYFAKTEWKENKAGDDQTHISVNHQVVDNDHMLRQVLAHEVIHHHLYQKYGNDVAKHGEHFQMLADRINAGEGNDFVTPFADHTEFRTNAAAEDNRFYHGSDGDTIRKIAKDGVLKVPTDDVLKEKYGSTKKHAVPVRGRVYISRSLEYPLIYAVGGKYVGSDSLPEWAKDEGGIVVVEPGTDSLYPDEDWVGEKFLTKVWDDTGDEVSDLIYDTVYKCQPRIVGQAREVPGEKHHQYRYYISYGKKIIKCLEKKNPEGLAKIASHAPNLSHAGDLEVKEAWVFDLKTITPKLKEDGSNFFELATRIDKGSKSTNASLDDWSGEWVHFTDVNKLGVNPKQFHQDPAGMYLFPREYKTSGTIWQEKKYKLVVELKPGAKVLDLSKLSMTDMKDMADKLEVGGDFKDIDTFWDALKNHYILATKAPGAAKWNKDFRELGYDAIFDDTESIHVGEVQLLVLNPSKARVIDAIRQNPDSGAFQRIKDHQKLVADFSRQYGDVNIKNPKTYKGYAGDQNYLAGEVEVTNGDNYITWRIQDENQRFMRLSVYDASKRSNSGSLGSIVEKHKEDEIRRAVDNASKFVFSEEN